MAGNNDDTIGCVVAVLAVGVGAWWLWGKYEIKEREPSHTAPTVLAAPRPTGMIEITATDSGAVWRLDAETVSGPRTARRAWISADYSKDNTVSFRTSKSLRLVNCDTGAVQELAFVAYDADSKVILTDEYTQAEAESHYYPPGTVGASVPVEACKAVYDEAKPISDASGGSSR